MGLSLPCFSTLSLRVRTEGALVTCGGGPRMDSSTGSSRSPWSRPKSVSTVSTTKKYLGESEGPWSGPEAT